MAFSGRHHDSWSRYHSIVSARAHGQTPWAGAQGHDGLDVLRVLWGLPPTEEFAQIQQEYDARVEAGIAQCK